MEHFLQATNKQSNLTPRSAPALCALRHHLLPPPLSIYLIVHPVFFKHVQGLQQHGWGKKRRQSRILIGCWCFHLATLVWFQCDAVIVQVPLGYCRHKQTNQHFWKIITLQSATFETSSISTAVALGRWASSVVLCGLPVLCYS